MSEPEIIHPVPATDLDEWLRTLQTHLLHDPDDPEVVIRREHRQRTWRPEHAWAVRDRDKIVGTLAAEPRTMVLPGGATTDVHAVTGVSVAATHRRRGLLRTMITESLAEAHEQGYPMSGLIAAEWPIYGRYGYAAATREARYTYRIRGRGAAPVPATTGTVRPVSPDELFALAPDLFDRARTSRPGQFDRSPTWWARQLGVDGFAPIPSAGALWIVHEDDAGVVDGMLGWRTTRDFDLDNVFGAARVIGLVAATDDAYLALWSYLAGLDAIEELTFDNRPADEPIRWLLGDGRALLQTHSLDGLWLRLLDVPAALTARTYACDGELVLEVVDDDPGAYARGRVALRVRDGVATCEPTQEPAGLQLTQRTLASAYLGGHRLAALGVAGGVTQLEVGSLARADVMFSTPLEPWNQTHF